MGWMRERGWKRWNWMRFVENLLSRLESWLQEQTTKCEKSKRKAGEKRFSSSSSFSCSKDWLYQRMKTVTLPLLHLFSSLSPNLSSSSLSLPSPSRTTSPSRPGEEERDALHWEKANLELFLDREEEVQVDAVRKVSEWKRTENRLRRNEVAQ